MSTMTIRELAEQVGCTPDSVRYYERLALLPPPPRSAGGHRRYDEHHRRRLQLVRRSRELGFSLEEIRQLLALVDGVDEPCAAVAALTRQHLEAVKRRIAQLRDWQATLESLAAACAAGREPGCPMLHALSADRGQ